MYVFAFFTSNGLNENFITNVIVGSFNHFKEVDGDKNGYSSIR